MNRLFEISLCTRAWVALLGPGRLLCAAMALSAAAARAQQPAPEAGATSDDIEKGKQAMVTYLCYSCHGHSGNGSDSGPRLDTLRLSFEDFSSYVREPAGSMPPYKLQSQLPDAAMASMYAFLKSLPLPPDSASVPLLNDE